MSDDATRMNRFSLRFADAELEASFAEEQARKLQRLLRLVSLWSVGIVLVVWALAGVIYPEIPNAIKFTPDGGRILVTARKPGHLVEVAVADTGAGIAPADLPLMFEEFRQVGTDQARKTEGTGLGLALSKRFAELHGGSIRVESILGKGSTFILTLAEQDLAGTNR